MATEAESSLMKHDFIDRYSSLNSFIHRLDPRGKILMTLLFIIVVVVTPPTAWQAFTLCFLILVALFLFSQLPLSYVLKRSLVVLPFVGVVALFIPFFHQGEVAGSYNIWLWHITITRSGLLVLWNVLIKSWLSILSLILLTSTTRFPDLLKGMERLRLPGVMVMIISFMYRYIFVLIDEAMRMQRARDSRNFSGRWLWKVRTIGNMIGTLFLRSYERGERVYTAMVARGFEGQFATLRKLRFSKTDWYFIGASLPLLALATWIAFSPLKLI